MSKKGFTLIEVMIAVMIITVVIAALMRLESNTSYFFSKIRDDIHSQNFMTLFLHLDQYGLKNEQLSLDKTVEDFDIDDDLRRKLKAVHVRVKYIPSKKLNGLKLEDKKLPLTYLPNIETGRTLVLFPKTQFSYARIVQK